MKIINFNLELAKKIVSEEIEGKVLYRNKTLLSPLQARILCLDYKHSRHTCRGIVLVTSMDGAEFSTDFDLNSGEIGVNGCTKLMLEVPDIYSYKKGDILVSEGEPFIFDRYDSEKDEVYSLAGLMIGGTFKEKSNDWCFADRIEGKADQVQIGRLMEAIKENGYEWDAEKLELVKLEKKYEFKPFDRVVASTIDGWQVDLFSHMDTNGWYSCIGGLYEKVLPFEGNERCVRLNLDECK